MSLHFILDGYNIIKQTSYLQSDSLSDSRNRLLGFIKSRSPQGSPKNEVTIVFDGKKDFTREINSTFVKIIFSQGESADSYIGRLAEEYPCAKCLVVVTDDKELKFFVRKTGAQIMSVKEFLSRSIIKKEKASHESKDISFYESNRITSELRKLWLKET